MKTKGEKMLTVKQVAELLDAGESTIRTMCINGLFPNAQRFGDKVWAIPESDLNKVQVRKRGRPPKKKTGKEKSE